MKVIHVAFNDSFTGSATIKPSERTSTLTLTASLLSGYPREWRWKTVRFISGEVNDWGVKVQISVQKSWCKSIRKQLIKCLIAPRSAPSTSLMLPFLCQLFELSEVRYLIFFVLNCVFLRTLIYGVGVCCFSDGLFYSSVIAWSYCNYHLMRSRNK